ncbi:hypothetical protein QVD17_16330 [Tagetes erecta]|uniref:Uncharacterized protein n=1 Tax=Tagetes erecta TaxID=13708 RepID=A0AAD8P0K8_TARER|nr:hypothetical protein QVD17_16330 [Tagetes erecta]
MLKFPKTLKFTLWTYMQSSFSTIFVSSNSIPIEVHQPAIDSIQSNPIQSNPIEAVSTIVALTTFIFISFVHLLHSIYDRFFILIYTFRN